MWQLQGLMWQLEFTLNLTSMWAVFACLIGITFHPHSQPCHKGLNSPQNRYISMQNWCSFSQKKNRSNTYRLVWQVEFTLNYICASCTSMHEISFLSCSQWQKGLNRSQHTNFSNKQRFHSI